MAFTIFDNAGMTRALLNLNNLSSQLAISNERLTTGKKVNRAADDPAGIIAATQFDYDIAGLDSRISNAQRIESMVDTADGALAEISTLISSIQSDVIAASDGSVTATERAAYQEEIDLAIDAIDRLVNTTSFNGTKLLDGTLGYSTSGVDSSDITNLRINSANTSNGTLAVTANVTAATIGQLSYSNSWLVDDVTLTITGDVGSDTITVASGTGYAGLETAINAVTSNTGVVGRFADGKLYIESEDYGADGAVSVTVDAGTFALDGGVTSTTGTDAVVTINSTTTTVTGQEVVFTNNGLNGSFTLTDTLEQNGGSTSFTITSDGAGWKLDATSDGEINFGLDSLATTGLGTSALGFLSSLKSDGTNALSSGNYTTAQSITSAASSQVARERGRLGALSSYTLGSMTDAFTEAKTAMEEAKSSVMDIDYTEESARNAQLQTMLEVGTAMFAAMNQNRTNILTLLGITS